MIRLDTSSYTPIYEQIKRDIRSQIVLAVFKPGEALPSIRDLAAKLVVNPNTVARAYRELEQEGFITTRKGKGCFVSDRSASLLQEEKQVIMKRIVDRSVEEAKKYGFSTEEVKLAFEKSMQAQESLSRGGKK
jgi:GntR family transcriptional regulator